jgi:hypothetical protein
VVSVAWSRIRSIEGQKTQSAIGSLPAGSAFPYEVAFTSQVAAHEPVKGQAPCPEERWRKHPLWTSGSDASPITQESGVGPSRVGLSWGFARTHITVPLLVKISTRLRAERNHVGVGLPRRCRSADLIGYRVMSFLVTPQRVR